MGAEHHLNDEQFGKPKAQWEEPDIYDDGGIIDRVSDPADPGRWSASNKNWTMHYGHEPRGASERCDEADPRYPHSVCALPKGHESPHVPVYDNPGAPRMNPVESESPARDHRWIVESISRRRS